MALADRLPFDALLDDLAADPRLVHLERLPPRPPRNAELARPLPPEVARRVPPGGLWAHQAAAIDLVRAGRSVAIATGTASGKSLCYQLPIAEATLPDQGGAALLLFPTKALAHDQLRSLVRLDVPGLVPATYDGDCGPEERTWVRRNANVVLTNPEMLHHGVLPNHQRWGELLHRLRYVVLDELHVLRGVFGSHVAHLLRRLRRLCHHYGSDPTFVCCSATIGQPGRLASELCGVDVHEVLDDASPCAERAVALWNPAALADATGERTSTSAEAARVAATLIGHGLRTVVFCRSRRRTELVAADIRRHLPPTQAERVRPYRGGYLPEERREIEEELFSGRLLGVVATSALELGVDVGGLDACVLSGFPGTIASMWQQVGRAGRSGRPSVAVLVAGQDQLDQWLMAHPREAFVRPPEPAVVNPANPFVAGPQLACAAHERALTHDDHRYWGEELDDGVRALVQADQLRVRRRRQRGAYRPAAVWDGRGWPSHGIGLRSSSAGEYRIERADGELVGTVDDGRAFDVVHPGAIYLHQGRAYRVVELSVPERAALVEPTDDDEYTLARSDTTLRILEVDRSRPVGGARLHLGSVEVVSQVTGYQRRDRRTHEVIATDDLHLPPTHLVTRSFWYVVPEAVVVAAGVTPAHLPGALHAAEHAAIGMLPLFTICDRWDVGGFSTVALPETGAPTIAIHDGYAGGAGIAELGFGAADRHLAATLDALRACPCTDGCPSCVQSPKCGNLNEPLHKAGAAALLAAVLGR